MFGRHSSFRVPVTFATGTTLTTLATDVRGFNHVAIEVATFASGLGASTANVYVQGCVVYKPGNAAISSAASATYRRLMDEGNYSAGAAIADWEVPSSTGNRVIVCRPAARADFIKVELSNATTHTFGCWVWLHD